MAFACDLPTGAGQISITSSGFLTALQLGTNKSCFKLKP
jgi:hypothetical protein